MTKLLRSFVIAVFILTLAVPVIAQDATPEGEATDSLLVCDSTLTLLVGLASRDYGYQGPGSSPGELEFGQYRNYFDGSIPDFGGDGEVETGEETMAESTEEAMDSAADTTANPSDQSAEDESITLLSAPVIMDEDMRCTEIRTSVEEFFYSVEQHIQAQATAEVEPTPANGG